MKITFPTEQVQIDFEQCVLQAWHEAHGGNVGQISLSWGEDRVVVMIEEVLFAGEQLLTQSKQGSEVLQQYMRELLNYIADSQAERLSYLLQRDITSTSVSVNTWESWVMFIFRLAE